MMFLLMLSFKAPLVSDNNDDDDVVMMTMMMMKVVVVVVVVTMINYHGASLEMKWLCC